MVSKNYLLLLLLLVVTAAFGTDSSSAAAVVSSDDDVADENINSVDEKDETHSVSSNRDDQSVASRRDGLGNSQQYHYSSYPQHGGEHTGLSFDLSTGIWAIVGTLVLLAIACLIYSYWGKGGTSGGGWGWDSRSGPNYKLNSMELAAVAEKVLTGIEKLYEIYKKHQH